MIENETMNIGSGVGYSINEIIDLLRGIIKEKVIVEHLAARQVDVSSVVLDISKLKRFVRFEPIDIVKGISMFYQDVRNGE